MAEVVGGKTKSIPGRIAEVAGWFPALTALIAAGAVSMLDANSLMPGGTPGWLHAGLNIYRGFRDQTIEATMGKTIPASLADITVAGIGLATMLSRKVLGFGVSIGGFLALAGIGWFLLKRFA